MAISYPTSIDVLTNPTATDQVATVDHASQHANANDILEALEAKVGVNSSAVTTSHDYKLQNVTGTDKAASVTGSEVLTNKTLTTPTIGSFVNANHNHQNSAGGGTLDTSAIASGTLATARLGSGTANSTTYLRGDQTWATISVGGSALTVMTTPISFTNGNSSSSLATTTTMSIGQVNFALPITVNKITFVTSGYSASGTVKFGMWSADGSTQIFTHESGTVNADAVFTTTLASPVLISAGQYYFGAVATGTSNFAIRTSGTLSDDYGTVSGEPKIEGSYTVSAGTIPSTITPTSITQAQSKTPLVRLDN